jgi:hypothetical protein
MVVMHRADLMAMVMIGAGLGHACSQGDDERQGGDSSFHRYPPGMHQALRIK